MRLESLSGEVRELELGVSKSHRHLFGEQRCRPDGKACRNGGHYRRRGGRDRRELRLRNGCDDWCHHQIAGTTGLAEQRRSDIAEHDYAGECRCDGSVSQISLGMHQLLVLTLSEPRFQSVGKSRGGLNAGKIAKQKERSADLRILARTILTFSEMSLHADQLDTSQRIVYKSKVLITKLATIHGDRLRVRKHVPASGVPVPEPTNLIYVWCNDFRERVSCPVKS